MTKPANQGDAASVHQRLLNKARETARPFNEVLQYFAMERLLYRLSRSPCRDSFILKGALLFRVWDVPDTRATRDIDLLARLDNSPENLAAVLQEVCTIEGDDGLRFDPGSVEARAIREDADYEGVRVRFQGWLGTARITMQVDVGFGDKVYPAAVSADYPVILDLPAPSLRMYPPESVVAEKVEAMVHLGGLNSRMKDFYDVWRLCQQFTFDEAVLREAIRQTFENRRTEVVPFNQLRADLLTSESMARQWVAFLSKSELAGPETFERVVDEIGRTLRPVMG